VAGAVSDLNKANANEVYDKLMEVAKRKTAEADVKLDNRGRKIVEEEEDFGDNVLIIPQEGTHGQETKQV
jgi:DNA topoisomerase-6 subunit B